MPSATITLTTHESGQIKIDVVTDPPITQTALHDLSPVHILALRIMSFVNDLVKQPPNSPQNPSQDN